MSKWIMADNCQMRAATKDRLRFFAELHIIIKIEERMTTS